MANGADWRKSIPTGSGCGPVGVCGESTTCTCHRPEELTGVSSDDRWSTPPTLMCTLVHGGGLFMSAKPVTLTVSFSPICPGRDESREAPLAPVTPVTTGGGGSTNMITAG